VCMYVLYMYVYTYIIQITKPRSVLPWALLPGLGPACSRAIWLVCYVASCVFTIGFCLVCMIVAV